MSKLSFRPSLALFLFMAVSSGCTAGLDNQNSGSQYSNTAGSLNLGAAPVNSDCARMSVGVNADLNGFVPYGRDNVWNTNISQAPVAPNSAAAISNYSNRMGYNPHIHGDFSAEAGESYNVVDSSTQPLQRISIDQYPGESDIMPLPLSSSAVVQGGSQSCANGGDCHLLVIDRNQCWLYEAWLTSFDGASWHASNIAVWDLLNGSSRPVGWTAADAAGLPVFSGLVRYDEVAKGEINHALRFTLSHTGNSFVAPATHSAGYDTQAFSMGTRFRLKANFDVSAYSPADQIILNALKNYGMILADNGTDLEIAGAKDDRWSSSDVVGLQNVHLTDFEVLASGPIHTRASLPQGLAPEIDDFTASSSSISAGDRVTLSWSATNDSWDFIDVLGPVRGGSVTVSPTATTTYTLNSTNGFGRSTRSVTVEVH